MQLLQVAPSDAAPEEPSIIPIEPVLMPADPGVVLAIVAGGSYILGYLRGKYGG